MTTSTGWSPYDAVIAPVGGLPTTALSGVRSRRIVAVCLDLVVVSIISFALWLGLLVLTFGLSLLILPPLFPFVAFFYNGLSVSGRNMATPGMRGADLEMRMAGTGARVPFIVAAVPRRAVLPQLDVSTHLPRVARQRRQKVLARHAVWRDLRAADGARLTGAGG